MFYADCDHGATCVVVIEDTRIMKKTLIESVLALCGFVAVCGGAAANPVSQFPITIDGQFTGGVGGGVVQGEWSDVTPQAFIAPPDAGGVLQATTLNDSRANSLLYAGLAPESVNGPVNSLYLMYAFKDLTEQVFPLGKLIFDVAFPVTYQGNHLNVDVRVLGTGQTGSSFYRIEVLADGSVVPPGIVIENGAAAAGFGPSPLSSSPHFLMELEVRLLIDPGFGTPGGPFPPNGLPGGVYSPAPTFWNASGINNFVDPPISSAMFTIQPDGSTIVDVSAVPLAVPEPSVFALFGLGLAALCIRRGAATGRATKTLEITLGLLLPDLGTYLSTRLRTPQRL